MKKEEKSSDVITTRDTVSKKLESNHTCYCILFQVRTLHHEIHCLLSPKEQVKDEAFCNEGPPISFFTPINLFLSQLRQVSKNVA